jgi:hypothetical protein
MPKRNWKDEAGELSGKRLAFSAQYIGEQNKQCLRFFRYVYGDPPMPEDAAEREDYFSQYSFDRDVEKMKQGWDTTCVPIQGVLKSTLLSAIMGGNALWMPRAREGATELERARSELYARLAQVVWDAGAKDELNRALDDAFMYRLGWMETVYDEVTNFPKHVWRSARDVLYDCETRSPRHQDLRWIATCQEVSMETARYFAREVWDAKDHEFTPIEFDDPNRWEGGTHTAVSRWGKSVGDNASAPTEFVRIVRMFVRGQNPQSMTANMASRKMTDPAGRDAVYDGKDHVLILEACQNYDNATGYKVIGRTDWPFPCDPGETPLTLFRLSRDNRALAPASVMQPSQPLQIVLNSAVQGYFTDMLNSARRVVAVQEESFKNEAEVRKAIESNVALVVAEINSGHSIEQALQIKNFGQPNTSLNVGQQMAIELHRIVSQLQAWEVQVRANQTAYNTSVQNEQSRAKLEDVSEPVERAATMMQRKAIMCARATLNYDEVRRYVLAPGDYEDEQIVGGKPQRTSELWPTKPDWQDIRDETDVNLEPLSMRFTSPERQAADIKEISDYQLQAVRVVADTAAKGNVAAARAVARATNNAIKAIAKLKNIRNWEEFTINPDEIGLPVPEPEPAPQLDPNIAAQAQADQQTSALNAQQEAALTRLQQMGADPNAMPPDMQGGF